MPDNPQAEIEHLLEVLSQCDVTSMGDAQLREVLVTAERVRSAADSLGARVMMQMHERAHRDDMLDPTSNGASVPTGTREEFVIDEVAVELHCSRVAASHRFATAWSASEHDAVASAWATGHLDGRKAQIIGDLLSSAADVDHLFLETLATAAVQYASTHTAPQLRAWLSRRVIAVDPDAAEVRRERATADRRVRFTALPDGVAELSALMPAVQARHLYDALTSIAHASDRRDARTLDQRRSDALYDLCTGRAEPPQIHLQVTVPNDTLIDGAQSPSDLAGYGPLTPGQVRELLGAWRPASSDADMAAATTWRALVTDPATGMLTGISEPRYRPSATLDDAVRARDVTCRFPGCRRSALTSRNGVDLDHTVPWPKGATATSNLACLCRHHHRLKHSPGWSVTLDPDGTMHWTTPVGRQFTTHPWRYSDTDPPEQRAA